MNKLLSICIPTYNRSILLKQCLDSIFSSVEGFERDVEIIISDNASTDDTESVVTEYLLRYPQLRYHRNRENIGPERNFYAVASLATGQHVWIFGDDDKMIKESVAEVIDLIKAGFTLIVTNFEIWSKDFSRLVKPRGINIKKSLVFDRPNELMKHLGLHLGYITSIIMLKKILFSCPPDEYERYIEYGYPHVFSIYAGSHPHCHATYISKPLIQNRTENHGDYDKYKYYAIGGSLIFDALVAKGYSKTAAYHARHRVIRDLLVFDIITRKLNNGSVKGIFSLMFSQYKQNWIFWCAAVPALIAPRSSVRFLRKAVRAARRIRA